MKKQLLNLSLIASAVMLFASTAFSQPVAPVKVVDCPAIDEVPEIDGLANEGFWSPDQDFTIFSLSAAEDWTGEADFDVSLKFAWGWSYFYIYVVIKDDVEHDWDGSQGNSYEFDAIETFFQLDTNTVPVTYTDNTIQHRFNRGFDQGSAGWTSSIWRTDQTVDNYVTYWENTADGWLVEAAIPWTNVMPNGSLPEDIYDWIESGATIGFDLQGADSDGTDPAAGARASGTQMMWDEDGTEGDTADGTEDLAWNNTSVFGYLTLVGTPIVSTQEVAAEGSFSVYPNPATSTLHINGANTVELYTITGQLVMTFETNVADISNLASGVYIAVSENGESQKLMIK